MKLPSQIKRGPAILNHWIVFISNGTFFFLFSGYAPSYNDTIVAGDVESLKFACYYCKDDQILAVTTVGVDPLAAQYAELTYNGVTLYKKDISDNPLSLSMIKI